MHLHISRSRGTRRKRKKRNISLACASRPFKPAVYIWYNCPQSNALPFMRNLLSVKLGVYGKRQDLNFLPIPSAFWAHLWKYLSLMRTKRRAHLRRNRCIKRPYAKSNRLTMHLHISRSRGTRRKRKKRNISLACASRPFKPAVYIWYNCPQSNALPFMRNLLSVKLGVYGKRQDLNFLPIPSAFWAHLWKYLSLMRTKSVFNFSTRLI